MKLCKLGLIAVASVALALLPLEAFAKGGGGGKGGGFSGGSRSFSSPSRSYSSPTPSYKPSSPPSSSYSAPSKNFFTSPSPATPTYKPSSPGPVSPSISPSMKQAQPSYDSAGAKAQKQAESRAHFEQSKPQAAASPKMETPGAPTPKASAMPRDYSAGDWGTRERRAENIYGSGYRSRPPPVVYQDSFSPFFMGWLVGNAMSSGDRDRFVYHHRESMDPARYEELKKQDAGLEKRLKALEETGVKKDPTFVPDQFKNDKDLVYKDEVAAEKAQESTGFFTYFWVGLMTLLVGGAVWYFVFKHRYTVRSESA